VASRPRHSGQPTSGGQRSSPQEPQRWIADLPGFATAWKKDAEALAIFPVSSYPQVQQLGIEMSEIYRDHQYIVVSKR